MITGANEQLRSETKQLAEQLERVQQELYRTAEERNRLEMAVQELSGELERLRSINSGQCRVETVITLHTGDDNLNKSGKKN